MVIISKQSSFHVLCQRFFICILVIAVVLLSTIVYYIYNYAVNLPAVCHSKECLRSAAAYKQNMDLNVDPCDDFYSYVCGNWADDHPRPEQHETYSWYDERQSKIYRHIRTQLEASISQWDPKPVAQAKFMYQACMKEADQEHRDYSAILRFLREFDLPLIPTLLNNTKASNREYKFDWISSVAKIQRKLGLNVLVGFDIVEDHRDKNLNRLTLQYDYSPQDLQFPTYEWSKLKTKAINRRSAVKSSSEDNNESENEHVDDDDEYEDEGDSAEGRKRLAESFAKVINAVNPSVDVRETDDIIIDLAAQFAKFYHSLMVLQNMTDTHIEPKKPYPVWQQYLDVLFANQPDVKPLPDDQLQLTSEDIEFLGKLIDVLSDQPPALIELYVWQEVMSFLSNHEFNAATLEEECAEVVQKLMGLAVSYTIADKNFLNQTKPRVDQMLADIRSAFQRLVLESDWMDADSKYASLEKSKAMKSLIGFPEWIMDAELLQEHYRGLQISQTRHLENWVTALELINSQKLRSWRMENSDLWDLDLIEINAYHLTARNAINIPVAIIQYPFYYLGLEALNYGALGDTIAHELTHGFDNEGRHFDKYGNKKAWWSNHTLQEYDKRAECFEHQYSSYYVPEAESFNIADNGGTREAFYAYRAYVKRNGPEAVLPGFENFTHEQLFFISVGNQYCGTGTPKMAKELLEDEHSPAKYRVRGVLSNMPEFSEAFRCPSGSKMNPRMKCRLW